MYHFLINNFIVNNKGILIQNILSNQTSKTRFETKVIKLTRVPIDALSENWSRFENKLQQRWTTYFEYQKLSERFVYSIVHIMV